MSAIQFIQILIRELTTCSDTPLRVAATTAYETALSPIHTRIVRGVVFAGTISFPTQILVSQTRYDIRIAFDFVCLFVQ